MGEHLDSLPVDHPLNRYAGLDPEAFDPLTEDEKQALSLAALELYVEAYLA
jgi:hypothetical protein